MENNENLEHPQQRDYAQHGIAENEQNHYSSASTDDDPGEKSDLDNSDEDEEDISGDLAGNASGNEDAEDE